MTSGPRMQISDRYLEAAACLALGASLALVTCFVSDRMYGRLELRDQTVATQFHLLRGEPFYDSRGTLTYMPPLQNRVLFPGLLWAASHWRIHTPAGWYLLLRLLSALAAFCGFWAVLRKSAGASPKLAAAGSVLLALSLVCTFTLPMELPSDFPDALFAALFVAAALGRRRALLLALVLVAATNRESCAFAGVVWFFLYGLGPDARPNWRETGFAALASAVGYAAVLLLRLGFGGWKAVGGNTQALTLATNAAIVRDYVADASPVAPLTLTLCMAAPALLWITANRRALSHEQRSLLFAALAIALITCLFGIVSEPRVFIPASVVATFVAVWSEAAAAGYDSSSPSRPK